MMLVSSDPHTLTSEKRAILDVLAGQVAIELEAGRLVDEKVRLERELAIASGSPRSGRWPRPWPTKSKTRSLR